MPRRNTFLICVGLLAAQPFNVAHAGASDWIQHCRPIHGIEDFRKSRPAGLLDYIPAETYYLFDNLDLLTYRIRLLNTSAQVLTSDGNEWEAALTMRAIRDGQILDESQISFEIIDRSIHRVQYFADQSEIENPSFRLRAGGIGAVPDQPFTQWRREIESVDTFPGLIAPNEEYVLDVRIFSPDPERPLEHGLYLLNFASRFPSIDCGQAPYHTTGLSR